jgi:hypothetical protein
MPEHDETAPRSGRHAAPETDDAPTASLTDAEPDDAPVTTSEADPGRAELATGHSRTSGPHAAHRAARPRRRLIAMVAVAAAAAAGIFVAGMMAAGPVTPMPTPMPAAIPVAAPPILPTATTPTSTTRTTTGRTTTSSTRTRATVTSARTVTRPAADTGTGCGHRAVARGVFNAACAEYQGYLDPGRAAGRAPSSGDLQHDDGCQKGYIPKSEC